MGGRRLQFLDVHRVRLGQNQQMALVERRNVEHALELFVLVHHLHAGLRAVGNPASETFHGERHSSAGSFFFGRPI